MKPGKLVKQMGKKGQDGQKHAVVKGTPGIVEKAGELGLKKKAIKPVGDTSDSEGWICFYLPLEISWSNIFLF
jgi:hypothetical protein